MECWGDDVPNGEVTSFPMAVKCGADETVCFSWVLWPSKSVRDEAMPKIMEAARRMFEENPMPFDGKRMIYGGFEMIVDALSRCGPQPGNATRQRLAPGAKAMAGGHRTSSRPPVGRCEG